MKKKLLVVIAIISVFGAGILAEKLLFSNNNIEDGFNDSSQVKHEHMLSMMLETDNGSGEYSLEERSSWPTKEDGYVFNSTLSKCEKGSKLRWDDENNAVVMVGTTSDKCYVYFDVYNSPSSDVCNSGDNLAGCVKKLYQESNSDLTHIYYHDSTLENGAGDNSYRYAGSSTTTNNYVCFGSDADTCPNDNLYRIIGVFDGRVKLIKADYATSALLGTDTSDYYGLYSDAWSASYYQGDSSNLTNIAAYYWNEANYSASYSATGYYNDWSYSELNKTHLNKNFLENIGSAWANMIDKTTWKAGGNTSANMYHSNAQTAYTNEITSPSTQVTNTYESKVGLMYVSDYYYGASPTYWTYQGSDSNGSYNDDYTVWTGNDYSVATRENWMYMGLTEWTMTRESSDFDLFSNYVYFVDDRGYVAGMINNLSYAARPVFYLKSSVNYISGSGTKINPIVIN